MQQSACTHFFTITIQDFCITRILKVYTKCALLEIHVRGREKRRLSYSWSLFPSASCVYIGSRLLAADPVGGAFCLYLLWSASIFDYRVIFFIPIGSIRVLSMKTHVRGSLQREREQQMLFDHIRSTTSCKIVCILVQVLLPSGICKSRQPFPFHVFLFLYSWLISLASLCS